MRRSRGDGQAVPGRPEHGEGSSTTIRSGQPGKANREGISIMQLTAMFPDEAPATA